MIAMLLAACAPLQIFGAVQGGNEYMERVRATYAALGSYADAGVITSDYGTVAAPAEDRHSFATAFVREPRQFLLDFHKAGGDRFVIWGDPRAFHTWWLSTGVSTDYPNPNNLPAINLSDFPTAGLASKIPSLLYAKAAIPSSLSTLREVTVEGSDTIAGHVCYRLVGRSSDFYGQTGREVGLRKLTVWVDTQSWLIRQLLEEAQVGTGRVARVTTRFEPLANPRLDEARFAFTPPR